MISTAEQRILVGTHAPRSAPVRRNRSQVEPGRHSRYTHIPAFQLRTSGFQAKDTLSFEGLSDWIKRIQHAWSRGTQNTLILAKLMSATRRGLPYGDWSRLWRSGKLPFSKRKGEKLVIIGQELGTLDANNCSHLPSAWNTLYFLARLGRVVVERLIEQGRIRPGLSLREARELLAEHQAHGQRKNARSKLRIRLAKLTEFVHQNLGDWPRIEQEFARCQLLDLAELIRTAMNLAGELGASRSYPEIADQPHTLLNAPGTVPVPS